MEENEIPIDDRPLYGEASLGIQAETFINSPVGSFIVEKADRMFSESCERLVKSFPNDINEISDAQVDARVAIKIKEWLTEMVIAGRVAEANLKAKAELENQI